MSRRDKGDGSIYYSESRRRWVAQIEAPPSVDGTRRYLRRFRPTRKAAVDALHQLRREVERQRHPDAKQTLADWLERWVTRLEGVRAPKTVAAYRADVAHISDVIGRVQLSKLQPEHVHNLLAQLPKRGLAPKSALNIRTTLHTAIAQAVKDRMIDWNPVSVVDRPRVQRHDAEVFTLDEANAVLDALADDRLAALWTVAVAVGLRLSEALGLTWGRVDLDKGIIRVRQQLRHEGPAGDRHYVLRDLKNRKVRDIPLPPFAVDALKQHRQTQLEEKVAASNWVDGCCTGCKETGWGLVFTTHSNRSVGRALHETVARKHFQNLCEDVIGRRPRPHDLRHTAATLLIASGVPLAVVQEILGHSSIQVTKDLYLAFRTSGHRFGPPFDCRQVMLV